MNLNIESFGSLKHDCERPRCKITYPKAFFFFLCRNFCFKQIAFAIYNLLEAAEDICDKGKHKRELNRERVAAAVWIK